MAELNIFQCVTNGDNTGAINCDFDFKDIASAFATNANKEFDAAEIEAMVATLQGLSKADDPGDRVYPMGKFIDITDNSTDNQTEETGKGVVIPVRDGKPIYDFRLAVSTCGWKKLRAKFHNKAKNFRFILVDPAMNAIAGVKTASGGFAGCTLEQLIVKQYKFPTGSTGSNVMITMGWESVKDLEDLAIITFGSDVKVMNLVSGLLDFSLNIFTAITAGGMVEIKALGPCGMENIYDDWSTSLSQSTAWVATNTLTGLPIAVTGVVLVPGKKIFQVTMDTSDPNYPASAAYLTLSAAAPSVLEAAPINMPGYEGGSVQVLIP